MSSNSRFSFASRSGFTLLEATIALGIAGVVLAGLWLAANAVTRNRNVNQMTADMGIVVQNMRSLYKGHSGFTASAGGDITEAMFNAGVFPSSMRDEGGATLRTPWGTAVTMEVNDPTSFSLILAPSLPGEDCLQLVSRVTGPGRDRGLIGVTTDTNVLATPAALDAATPTGLSACERITLTFNVKG